MRTNVPEKLLAIVNEIDTKGNANLTRLTVLKKWFNTPERQSAFGIWIANRAASRKGKTAGSAGKLFIASRQLLKTCTVDTGGPDRNPAEDLHNRLRDFQNEYQKQQWGPVRVINNWNLLLIEQGLALFLWHADKPAYGYDLARDYCKHFDTRYGDGLNGPSRTKILEIVRFMFLVEAREEYKAHCVIA
jgi:hypothetical protein